MPLDTSIVTHSRPRVVEGPYPSYETADRALGWGFEWEASYWTWLFPVAMERYLKEYQADGGLWSWSEDYLKTEQKFGSRANTEFLFDGTPPKPEVLGFTQFYIYQTKSGRWIAASRNHSTNGSKGPIVFSNAFRDEVEAEFECARNIHNERILNSTAPTWPAIPRIPIGDRVVGPSDLGTFYRGQIKVKSKLEPFFFKLCQLAAKAESEPDFLFFMSQKCDYKMLDRLGRGEKLADQEQKGLIGC